MNRQHSFSTRKITITPNVNPYTKGSVIIEYGNTKVLITASVEESVPPFLKETQQGWLTAEYSMLPMATHTRTKRERNQLSGRTQEIQRLIGRSLRSVLDMNKLGKRTIHIDCDVLVADGGTRTASITGAFVALSLLVKDLLKKSLIKENPIKTTIAAISVGIDKQGEAIIDLNYEQDSQCSTDMNIVMNKQKEFIEIQGTAEKEAFSRAQLDEMLGMAEKVLIKIFAEQEKIIEENS